MKILYLLSHDISIADGVTKKILSQTSFWQQAGNHVSVIAFVPKIGNSILPAQQVELPNPLIHRLFSNRQVLNSISDFDPDIVYVRNFVLTKTLLKILKSYNTVIEVNTLETKEFKALVSSDKSVKSLLRYLVYLTTKNILFKYAAGIVAVTNEIKNEIIDTCKIKSISVIPNSINTDNLFFHKSKYCQNNLSRIKLFFIGTPDQPWQGIDLIENMALNMPQYDFFIIGSNGFNKDNVFYKGYLKEDEYYTILKECHICIGTMALYRKNMKEACPLKVREYLALGYPVVIGYDDTAFEDDFDYIFKINPLTKINYSELQLFIEKNANVFVPKSFIEPFISSSHIEKKRIQYFEKLLTLT